MNNIYSKPPSGGFFVVIKRDIEIKRKSMNHRFHCFFTESPSMPSAAGEACFFISESSPWSFLLFLQPMAYDTIRMR